MKHQNDEIMILFIIVWPLVMSLLICLLHQFIIGLITIYKNESIILSKYFLIGFGLLPWYGDY